MFKILIGILIPFIGTTLGASIVFLMNKKVNDKLEKFLLGFASGVMIAASIWSLIMPSIELSEKQNLIKWVPSTIGFLFGIIFLIIIDKMFEKSNIDICEKKNKKMMIFAVTLHNIPEGMAVGVAFSGACFGNTLITITSALALSIGIAIQNFPEGAIISMPLRSGGMTKIKSFIYGIISGLVEPISAFITILLTNFINQILPYLLSFAAGAMMYVVIEELIPEFKDNKKSKIGVIGSTIGFLIMMILDITLG